MGMSHGPQGARRRRKAWRPDPVSFQRRKSAVEGLGSSEGHW